MARETTKWPSTRWPITKIMSSDGCNGNRVHLEMGPWYDFREFGCHLGNVGQMFPTLQEQTFARPPKPTLSYLSRSRAVIWDAFASGRELAKNRPLPECDIFELEI